MMFCPNDKALMRRMEGQLMCPKCGYKAEGGQTSVIARAQSKGKETVILDAASEAEVLPKATYFCEKCGNSEAYYYLRQTRAADEATTRFLECTKCGYKWREYR